MIYSIIMDSIGEVLEEDYTQDFMNEMGILSYKNLEEFKEGYFQTQFFFKDEESMNNYIEEYDLHDYIKIVE